MSEGKTPHPYTLVSSPKIRQIKVHFHYRAIEDFEYLENQSFITSKFEISHELMPKKASELHQVLFLFPSKRLDS